MTEVDSPGAEVDSPGAEVGGRGAGMSVVLLSGEPPGDDLVAAVGAPRVRELGELKRRRARQWAQTSFPDAAFQTTDGGLTDAMATIRASPPTGEFVVVVAPELAVWREDVSPAALQDLSAGCLVSFGPVFDGGLYLLALARSALGSLIEAPSLDLGGRAAMTGLIELAAGSGSDVGMLQAERGLRSAGDVQALLADPLTDAELRGLLE